MAKRSRKSNERGKTPPTPAHPSRTGEDVGPPDTPATSSGATASGQGLTWSIARNPERHLGETENILRKLYAARQTDTSALLAQQRLLKPPSQTVASQVPVEVRPAIAAIATAADLGRLVREARQQRGLSQQDLADAAGVGRRFVSELENGKETVELGKALLVAAACGIDLSARRRG